MTPGQCMISQACYICFPFPLFKHFSVLFYIFLILLLLLLIFVCKGVMCSSSNIIAGLTAEIAIRAKLAGTFDFQTPAMMCIRKNSLPSLHSHQQAKFIKQHKLALRLLIAAATLYSNRFYACDQSNIHQNCRHLRTYTAKTNGAQKPARKRCICCLVVQAPCLAAAGCGAVEQF